MKAKITIFAILSLCLASAYSSEWTKVATSGSGDALTSGTLAQFAATTSAELAGVLSDEQGSGGGFVRATSPALTTPDLGTPSALVLTNATGLPLGLIQTATTSDFHNIGGTDDDVPEGADLTNAPKIRNFTIESPTNSENIVWFKTDQDITFTQIDCVCVGSSPSMTFNITHGTDITSTANVLSSALVCTSTTTGDTSTSFTDATVASGEWVKFVTTATSGTVTNCGVTARYTVD